MMIVGSVLYTIIASLSGYANGQDIYPNVRHALSVFVFISMATATFDMARTSDLGQLRRILVLASLIYILWTPTLIFLNGDFNIDSVRYEIIGGSIIACLSLFVMSIFIPMSFFEKIVGIIGAAVIILSVTRTYFVIAVFQIISARSLLFGKVKASVYKSSLFVLMIIISSLFISSGLIFGRWSQRVNAYSEFNGLDPTYATRISEWAYMLDKSFASFQSALFGSGFGAQTLYELDSAIGGGTEASIGFGHNLFLSILFTGGLLGGGMLIFSMLRTCALAYVDLRKIRLTWGSVDSDYLFLTIWCRVILVGSLVDNVFAAEFGNRGQSLWLGVGVGLFFGLSNLNERKSLIR
jgi:hypothetical protein